MKTPQPVTLRGDRVTLRPLAADQAADYLAIGQDPQIWQYLAFSPFTSLADAEAWIASMLTRQATLGSVTFSIFDNAAEILAGSSSYLDIRREHNGLEIGYTWYGTAFQRTHVNTATKLVLLQHAFETLGVNRVQLQTDNRNERSKTAITRIGATPEGVLRSHKINPDGFVRDSAFFSIIREDWPSVRTRLEKRLAS